MKLLSCFKFQDIKEKVQIKVLNRWMLKKNTAIHALKCPNFQPPEQIEISYIQIEDKFTIYTRILGENKTQHLCIK